MSPYGDHGWADAVDRRAEYCTAHEQVKSRKQQVAELASEELTLTTAKESLKKEVERLKQEAENLRNANSEELSAQRSKARHSTSQLLRSTGIAMNLPLSFNPSWVVETLDPKFQQRSSSKLPGLQDECTDDMWHISSMYNVSVPSRVVEKESAKSTRIGGDTKNSLSLLSEARNALEFALIGESEYSEETALWPRNAVPVREGSTATTEVSELVSASKFVPYF